VSEATDGGGAISDLCWGDPYAEYGVDECGKGIAES